MVHKTKKGKVKDEYYLVWIKDPKTQLISGEVVKGKDKARKKYLEFKKLMKKKI